MDLTVALRPAGPEDKAFLYRVYAGTREEELAAVDWSAAEKEQFLKMQFAAQHMYYHDQYPDANYDIVLRDGDAVGRLYVHRRPDEVRIVDIALLPESRNTGIGTSLLEDILREGAAAQKPVRIHVEKFNPALRLYERLGFSIAEDKGVYWLMEWNAIQPETGSDG
jgi:ribosomal protein S18 acetylase RimI-like enzyme